MIKPVLESSSTDFASTTLESLGCHLIFGEINDSTIKEAITFILKANMLFTSGELTLFINSSGGSVVDGFALIDLMRISRLPIATLASGNISSMGLLIACAGAKGRRAITYNTEIMAHQFSDSMHGKFHELVQQHKAQVRSADQFIEHFKRNSTMTERQIKKVLFGPSDQWLTPDECKKYGLVDVILDELPSFQQARDAQLSPQLSEQTPKIGKRKKR